MVEYSNWLNDRAKEMRKTPTLSEKRVKTFFEEHRIRYKFQVPIMVGDNKGYIVDFMLFNNLILEIDGNVHFTEEAKEKDKQRTKDLEGKGYKVIRMDNSSTKDCNLETAIMCRLRKYKPEVAERLERESEKKKKSDRWKNYHKYKSSLPDWDFKEKIWNLSGGHFK